MRVAEKGRLRAAFLLFAILSFALGAGPAVTNTLQPIIGESHFKEDIYAPYIMGSVDIGKLSVMGGLRVETTKVWANGPLQQLTPAERSRRTTYVGPVTAAHGVHGQTWLDPVT